MITHLLAEIASRAWGLKDRNYSSFLVGTAQKELALDRDGLDQLVLARTKAIVQHAQRTTRYYSEIFSEYGDSLEDIKSLKDIKRLPYLTRDVLRERLPDLISGGAISSAWSKSATGGTTSSPVCFYRDNFALWRKNAFSNAIDKWYGRRVGDRVAYLWGANQDITSSDLSFGLKLRNLTCQKMLMLPSTPLDQGILASHFEKLSRWAPSFLQAYPTPLYELCLFMQENGLRLPSLQAVSVTAETLLQEHRNLIEETLGLRVYNWYGSRELGRISSECEYHDGQHINEPSVYVEIEPDPSLPDQCGHLVITDLWNRATPFIRYKTGDIARIVDGECSCGRALKRIAGIEGRLVDTVVLPGGRKVPGVSLTNRVIKDFVEIAELQIVQKTSDSFLLRFVKGPSFSSTSLDMLAENLKTLLDTEVFVTFEEVAELPRGASGKVRFVISEVSAEQQSGI